MIYPKGDEMDILTFVTENPVISIIILLILAGIFCHLVTALQIMYTNTVWAIRGTPPVVNVQTDELDKSIKKLSKSEEDDENKLKDCR